MKLFIIGNGFDLKHGLKSTYEEFKKFIYKKNKKIYGDFLQKMSCILDRNHKPLFNKKTWSNFEDCIVQLYDIDWDYIIFDQIYPGSEDDIGKSWYWHSKICILDQIIEDDKIIKTPSEIKLLFNEWVAKLNKKSSFWIRFFHPFIYWKFKKLFSENSIFLNFNYTNTLEKIYGIDDKKIIHLHNSKENYIVGHNEKYIRPSEGYLGHNWESLTDEDGNSIYDDYSEIEMYHWIDEYSKKLHQIFYKNSEKIIVDNKKIFDKSFDEIIVLGFSFGRQDEIYIKKLLEKTPSNNWIIYYHTCEDNKRISTLFGKNKPKMIKW